MNYVRDEIDWVLDDNKTIFQRFESQFQIGTVNIGWSGADDTDATIDVYIGTWDRSDITSLKRLSQLGSQITLSTADSNLDANILNYAGVFDCIYIVCTNGSNTEGTCNIVITKGA